MAGGLQPGGAGPRKSRVLVMDDEPIIRDVVGVMLRHLGYEAAFAQDGVEALALYKKAMDEGARFDVVIMDLSIPEGMGGREAIGKLIALDPRAKAVVSTGYGNDPFVSDYRKHGFSGVVNKPFNMDALKNVIDRLTA